MRSCKIEAWNLAPCPLGRTWIHHVRHVLPNNVHHIESVGRTRINIGAEGRRSVANGKRNGPWTWARLPSLWMGPITLARPGCVVELSHGDESCVEWPDARVPELDFTAFAHLRRDNGGLADDLPAPFSVGGRAGGWIDSARQHIESGR